MVLLKPMQFVMWQRSFDEMPKKTCLWSGQHQVNIKHVTRQQQIILSLQGIQDWQISLWQLMCAIYVLFEFITKINDVFVTNFSVFSKCLYDGKYLLAKLENIPISFQLSEDCHWITCENCSSRWEFMTIWNLLIVTLLPSSPLSPKERRGNI